MGLLVGTTAGALVGLLVGTTVGAFGGPFASLFAEAVTGHHRGRVCGAAAYAAVHGPTVAHAPWRSAQAIRETLEGTRPPQMSTAAATRPPSARVLAPKCKRGPDRAPSAPARAPQTPPATTAEALDAWSLVPLAVVDWEVLPALL